MSEQEFLNTDKSNLALQTQYFADSLKNFNDIAVHSKMMLELIAKRVLGQPKVISTVYGTDGDYSPPVDEIVAVRVMQLTSQTTPVVITLNGLIPVMVSTTPTQIVTGPISSVSVKNIVAGNPVYVQFLDERAALMNNETSQDSVVVNGTVGLTGSLAPLPTFSESLIYDVATTIPAGSSYGPADPSTGALGYRQVGGGLNGATGTSLNYRLVWLAYMPNGEGVINQSVGGANGGPDDSLKMGGFLTEQTGIRVDNLNTTDSMTFSYLDVIYE